MTDPPRHLSLFAIPARQGRTLNTARRLVGIAAIAGIGFDLLLWGHVPRLGLTLFLLLVQASLLATVSAAGGRVHPTARLPLILTAFLAVGPVLREEPVTAALTALGALGMSAVFASTALDTSWLHAGARGYLRSGLRLSVFATVGGARVITDASRDVRAGMGPAARRSIPVLRGAAMALPLLLFFGLLLGSADPVFADRIGSALSWLRPRPVDELAVRAMLVLLVTYGAAGFYAYVVRARPERALVPQPLRRRLGLTEALVVLGSITTMFASFVVLQIRYLFGGSAHLAATGLTYAEYARRGFFELLVVAAAALCLLLVMAGLTRRAQPREKRLFSIVAGALTLCVLVILASAYRRLGLYEEAFGFTRLRTYVHVFTVWLGLLLVAVLLLELRERLRLVAPALVLATAGFLFTLQAVDVDGLIARHNLERAAATGVLDEYYLTTLSLDAVPALVAAAQTASPELRQEIDGQLACLDQQAQEARSWQSLSVSAVRARSALDGHDLGDAICERY